MVVRKCKIMFFNGIDDLSVQTSIHALGGEFLSNEILVASTIASLRSAVFSRLSSTSKSSFSISHA